MRRLVAAAVFIATIGALAALPAHAKPPNQGPPSVSITSSPSNPTISTNATFGLTIGGAPTSTECRESAGVGDRFTRSGSLGSADAGGSWTASSAFSTDGQRARVAATAGATSIAGLGASLADADVSARVSLAALPTGNLAGALVAARVSANDYFGSRLIVHSGGQVRLQLVRSWAGLEDVLGTVGVGSKYKPGQTFWLRLQALDSMIQAKAWTDGKVEPASWQLSVVDLTPLVGGSVGFGAHGGAGLSNQVEIATDDFSVTDPNAAGSVAPCPGGSASYSGLGLGGHVFRVRVNAASSQATEIYPWTINPPAPTVTITAAPDATTPDTDAAFEWTSEGVVEATTCSLDEETPTSCSSPASYASLVPGAHSFAVTVSNVTSSGSDTHTWLIEVPPPTVDITSGPPTNTTSRSAVFTVDVGGTPDSVSCALDGDAYPGGGGECLSLDGSLSLDDLSIGDHTIEVTATNVGGSDSESWTWHVFPTALPLLVAFTPTPATSASDPPTLIRTSSASGANAGAADCDTAITFTDEIAAGCLTPYAVNEALDCSAYSSASLPPGTYNPDPAPNCIEVETGSLSASLRAGLDARFENPCTANNWSSFPSIAADDPRIVYLFVVPEPDFSGSGVTIVPVISIVRFYVTGWDRSTTTTQGCPGNDPHPIYGTSYSLSLDDGDIWGHFIP